MKIAPPVTGTLVPFATTVNDVEPILPAERSARHTPFVTLPVPFAGAGARNAVIVPWAAGSGAGESAAKLLGEPAPGDDRVGFAWRSGDPLGSDPPSIRISQCPP